MAADSKYFRENPGSEYGDGVMLDEFHGEYSLVASYKKKDGNVQMKWGYPQKSGEKKPIDKCIPWKVKLGNLDQAINTLKYYLALLEPDKEQMPF